MSVSCECCVVSDEGLCVRPISRTEESYRLCSAWDLNTSRKMRSWSRWAVVTGENIHTYI